MSESFRPETDLETLGVVPVPQHVDRTSPGCRLQGLRIVADDSSLAPLVEQFSADVVRDGSLVVGAAAPTGPGIELRLVASLTTSVPPAQGVAPGGDADERFILSINPDGVLVEAVDAEGIRRGLTVLRQMLASAASDGRRGALIGCRIEDGPIYRWRGLSIDTARSFVEPEDVVRIIDLAAFYHLSVLHVHLSDDQAWRLQIPSIPALTEHGSHYSVRTWAQLVEHASARGVTLVPEIDVPGHCGALLRARPDLAPADGTWIDPTKPGALELVGELMAYVASIAPGRFVHIGGDEAFGMPEDLFATVVHHARSAVRAAGKEPVGWQESARAGLDGADVIQHWMVLETDWAVVERALDPTSLALMAESVNRSGEDVAAASAAGAAVIVSPASHAYLDRPYAELSADLAQEERRVRLGMRAYPPALVSHAYEWEPARVLPGSANPVIAGVEAAIWSESVRDIDDLGFLLLPRLAAVAEVAWSGSRSWPLHAQALAGHPRLWEAYGWHSWFRATSIPWREQIDRK